MLFDAYFYGQEHATLLHDRELQASFYSRFSATRALLLQNHNPQAEILLCLVADNIEMRIQKSVWKALVIRDLFVLIRLSSSSFQKSCHYYSLR